MVFIWGRGILTTFANVFGMKTVQDMEATKKDQNFLVFIIFFLVQTSSKYDKVGIPEMGKSFSNNNNNDNTKL